MDSLTQIVLGAAVGEAVLGKKVGNKAMLWGAIAGTIPDLDVFVKYFTDQITATLLHRGLSHSLIFSIVMAPVLGWLAHKIHKKSSATFKNWSWLFFWALVTHPILDCHTTWGTQFFWPFEYRIAWKNIFVADPLYTLPFLVCVIIAMCYKRTNPKRTKINNLGLIISTSYMFLTFVFKGITYNKFSNELSRQNIEYVTMDTRPTPLNSILWNAQVETKTGYRMAYYSLLDTQKEIYFSKEFTKNHHLLAPYKNQKVIKQLIQISAGWYYIEKTPEGLIFTDIRFGQFGFNPDTSPFFWKYLLQEDEKGEIKVTRLNVTKGGQSFNEALAKLWERIKGN